MPQRRKKKQRLEGSNPPMNNISPALPNDGKENGTSNAPQTNDKNKILKQVYHHINKRSELYWGLKEGDVVQSGTKRTRDAIQNKNNSTTTINTSMKKKINTNSKEKKVRVRTVSEGYGETTLGSISRLLRCLENLPPPFNLNSASSFVDIGSGFGKVVYHAKVFSNVKESTGIEYVRNRHQIAEDTLSAYQKDNTQWKDMLKGIKFICGDATAYAPFNYTHIYMYDCIFNDDTYATLAPQLDNSPFKVLVSYRTLPFLQKRGLQNIKQIGEVTLRSTGRQTFKAHIYVKL